MAEEDVAPKDDDTEPGDDEEYSPVFNRIVSEDHEDELVGNL